MDAQGTQSKRRVSTEGRYALAKVPTAPTTRTCPCCCQTWLEPSTFRWTTKRRSRLVTPAALRLVTYTTVGEKGLWIC